MNTLDAREISNPTVPLVQILEMQHHFMRNYNYLVMDPASREAVIIDPAWQMEKVEQAVADTGAVLREVLVTHTHPDHIHLARSVAERFDCIIRMSREEFETSDFDSPRIRLIDGGWNVGSMIIEPILTPGHTPGCVCYRIGSNLFTGDVLFAEGCGMCPSTEAARTMYDSLDLLKRCIDSHTRIYPGHSYGYPPGQTMGFLLKNNMYLQFDDPDTFAAFRMRSGQKKMSKLFGFK